MKHWVKSCFCLIGMAGVCTAADFSHFKVSDANGTCQIKLADQSDFQTAKVGSDYPAGAIGKTGSSGKMKIDFDSQNRFRLFPDSEVEIYPNANNPRLQKIVDLRLKKGKVEVGLEKFPKNYEMKVQTPTAVCGAMGTAFSVETDGTDQNRFECTEHSIKVIPKEYEEGNFQGFLAQIPSGSFVDATIQPGKENAFTKIETGGGPTTIQVGAEDHKEMKVAENSKVELAQEQKKETQEVALKVEKGKVGDLPAGKYLVEGNETHDVTKVEEAVPKFDAYLAAAKVEGSTRSSLEKMKSEGAPQPEIRKKEEDLQKAADDATEKRKALFAYRDEIRRAVRQGLDATRGGNRPTQVPRIPR